VPPWPIAVFGPLPSGPAAYRLVGWLQRLLGIAALLLLIAALLMLFVAASAWGEDLAGWEGLILAIAIMLAVLALLGAAGLSLPAHFTYRHWTARSDRAIPWARGSAIAYLVVGAFFWVPLLTGTTPLDLYTAVFLFGLAMVGALQLWAVTRPGVLEWPGS
jgi:hypothetical protein